MRKLISTMPFAFALLWALGIACLTPQPGWAQGLDDMTGCWLSQKFDATLLLKPGNKPESAQLLHEKMLLRFWRVKGTEFLVLGYIYEWDEKKSYVLGPTYQNGVFDITTKKLTFGFPKGSLDHVTLLDSNTLLYIHSKSSDKAAMSARLLKRIDCQKAEKEENALRQRQSQLGK